MPWLTIAGTWSAYRAFLSSPGTETSPVSSRYSRISFARTMTVFLNALCFATATIPAVGARRALICAMFAAGQHNEVMTVYVGKNIDSYDAERRMRLREGPCRSYCVLRPWRPMFAAGAATLACPARQVAQAVPLGQASV